MRSTFLMIFEIQVSNNNVIKIQFFATLRGQTSRDERMQ